LLHPPLSQVAFEVNFANCFAVETRIAEYQNRVKDRYPRSGGEYVVRLPSTVAFGKPPKEVEGAPLTPMRSFVFQNATSSRIIRVSVVNFSLVVTDYLHFDDYIDALTAALTPAIEIFQLENVDRIGLRYINQIGIPAKAANTVYEKYVRSPIRTDTFSGRALTNFLTEVSLDLDTTKRLTIRSGLLPYQPGSATQTYLLDLDCFSQNVALASQSTVPLLAEYHEAIEAQFIRAVTPGYLKHMADGSDL
jgi:uncharacterized protein (TIGR04255 family)